MDAPWTLPELVAEVAARIAALPAPKNGQVRAVPDERTVRYYVTLGLLDRPSAMRGRTALYGPRHVAQVVAIKRLQAMGRSLQEIQAVWSTLDDPTLARMSGMALPSAARPAARAEFWKREPRQADATANGGASRALDLDADAARAAASGAAMERSGPGPSAGRSLAEHASAPAGPGTGAPPVVELRIELAPHVVLSLSVVDDRMTVSPADVRAIRAAAAPVLAELASRRLASHPASDPGGDE
ncbi:MAG TPA: MerR family transcriptional regulator [Kofleriaceae bacterium]|nr:MerR family transcriptional regulator [Kofleriaceae bacterium]